MKLQLVKKLWFVLSLFFTLLNSSSILLTSIETCQSPQKEAKFDISDESLQSPSYIPIKHQTNATIRVINANLEDQGEGNAPGESFGLRQRNKYKRVRQETVMVFIDERTMESDVPELNKNKRGSTTPRQPTQSPRSAHSSLHPDANKVTYYLLLLFFDFGYLQNLMLFQTPFYLGGMSTSTLKPSRHNQINLARMLTSPVLSIQRLQ